MTTFEITNIAQKDSKLVIQTNFDEVKAALEKKCEGYRDLIITEDNFMAAKKDAKMLASMRLDIENYRKTKKKEFEEPIKRFEDDCKALVEIITKTETPMLEQIKKFDDDRREQRKKEAETWIAEKINEYQLSEKFAAALVVKDEYILLSATKKSIKEDIDSCAKNLKELQNKELEDVETLRKAVAQESETLLNPMSSDKFVERFLKGEELEDLLKEVADTAENFRMSEALAKQQAEEKARKEAEEAERLQKEQMEKLIAEKQAAEEAAKKAEEEAKLQAQAGCLGSPMQNNVGCILTPPTNVPSCSADMSAGIPDVMRNGYQQNMSNNQPQTAAPTQNGNNEEAEFIVSFSVKGSFSKLRELNQYLKTQGIAYQVMNQVRVS